MNYKVYFSKQNNYKNIKIFTLTENDLMDYDLTLKFANLLIFAFEEEVFVIHYYLNLTIVNLLDAQIID